MEVKLRRNAKKKVLADGGIIYRLADKFNPFRHCAIGTDQVIGLIFQEHQTNSTHSGENKLSQH